MIFFLYEKRLTQYLWGLNGVEGINSETGKCDYTIRGCFERLSQIKWELKTHGGTQGVPGQLTIIIASIQPSRLVILAMAIPHFSSRITLMANPATEHNQTFFVLPFFLAC